jgi:hypothetical protein
MIETLDRAQAASALRRFMTALDERPSFFLLDGDVPVLRRAVFLYGSVLMKTRGMSDVDVLLIYYAPGLWHWSRSLLEIESGDSELSQFDDKELRRSRYAAFQKIRQADIPRRKHIHSIAQDGLSPDDPWAREKGDRMGTLKQVLPLWTRTDTNWREKVDRFENGKFPNDIIAPPQYSSLTILERDLPEDIARRLSEDGNLYRSLYALTLWANWSCPPDDLNVAPMKFAEIESNLTHFGLAASDADSRRPFSESGVNRF